nr:hemolymph lipopolysaccharide-binding protein-like [Megalopta genalis]
MQKFSLTCLVFTIAALIIAEFSSGQPTNLSKHNGTEIGGSISCPHSVDKIGCIPTLDRCDYVATPGLGAHKVHKRKMTWNEARKICLMEGAHLAILDSASEEALFKGWMKEAHLDRVWLGFHDLFEEGSWTTVTGELVDTMSYHPWGNDEPNNLSDRQHCAALWEKFKEGGADDIGCDSKCPFVCEINLCNSSNPSPVPNDAHYFEILS